MGFRFRKSINLGGGFKVNLSKSGIGYSFGVPGYRITKTAKGTTRKTYSIPGTGVSYVQESKNKKKNKIYNNTSNNSNLNNKTPYNCETNLNEITSAPIEQLQSTEHKDLIKQIETLSTIDNISTILLFLIIFSAIPGFIICPIVGVILKL